MVQYEAKSPRLVARVAGASGTRIAVRLLHASGMAGAPHLINEHCGSGGTPLDQGDNGTCVPFSFGRVLSTNLLNKYAVSIGAKEIADRAIANAENQMGEKVWEGNLLMECPETWNKSAKAFRILSDTSNDKRYTISLRAIEIMTFDAALEEMRRLEMGHLEMMIALKTGMNGSHAGHAIAAFACDPIAKTITARNSWAARVPNMTVNADNFLRAVTVDPIIDEWAWPPAKKKKLTVCDDAHPYQTTELYDGMPKLHAHAKKLEADAKALPAAQEAQRKAEKAREEEAKARQVAEDKLKNAEKQVLPPNLRIASSARPSPHALRAHTPSLLPHSAAERAAE